ncbi:MAG: hypothetical protein M1325_01120 [Actinobacteria bacterium]|nr:hypothetical protein [Actinomycetota bacterium]
MKERVAKIIRFPVARRWKQNDLIARGLNCSNPSQIWLEGSPGPKLPASSPGEAIELHRFQTPATDDTADDGPGDA